MSEEFLFNAKCTICQLY